MQKWTDRRLLWLVLGTISLVGGFLSLRNSRIFAQESVTETRLSFATDTASYETGDIIPLRIVVHPTNATVTALELELEFDSAVIRPISSEPAIGGLYTSRILPNCDAGETTPCPEVLFTTGDTATLNLAVDCTEAGCTVPLDAVTPHTVATVFFEIVDASAQNTLVTVRNLLNETQVAALESDNDTYVESSYIGIGVNGCSALYDTVPNSSITVSDVMKVANQWETVAGNPDFDGQVDLNGDYRITVSDIQLVANQWGQTCP